MKKIQLVTISLIMAVILTVPVFAQPELPSPGITPDSPLYFFDAAFDRFQSAEKVADEKAAEIQAMAEKNHEKGLTKALERYEKAMEKRQIQANESEVEAEEVARQASNHLMVLARVREQVPEQARQGIDRAINESARGREESINALEKKNPEKATAVAEATLEEVMANTPEEAQFGLQTAMQAAKRKGKPEGVGDEEDETEEDEEDEMNETDAGENASEQGFSLPSAPDSDASTGSEAASEGAGNMPY